MTLTDHSLARADEALTELIDLIETARTLPMSSSCVVPRERMLDLLDGLREVLPPEIAEARNVVAQRDRMLSESRAHAEDTVRTATEQADVLLADARALADQMASEARSEADRLVTDARAEAARILSEAEGEQTRLVSAEAVHLRAAADATALRSDAEQYRARVMAEADDFAAMTRSMAEQHAAKLTVDTHDYADRTLAELVENLSRLASTAENGRIALARRAPGAGLEQGDDFLVETGLR